MTIGVNGDPALLSNAAVRLMAGKLVPDGRVDAVVQFAVWPATEHVQFVPEAAVAVMPVGSEIAAVTVPDVVPPPVFRVTIE